MSARDAFETLVSHLGEDGPASVPVRVHPLACVHASATLAEGVVVQAGAYLAAGVELGRGVRIGPNAVFVDPEPGAASRTVVKEGACIGANAVVHAGVTVAARAVVRPGAVVTCSVPPGAIVEG
ncbi:MAG: hypothetical protein H7Z19_18565, partial [Chitinophagaceae bacterium]|nr:hypothetical protein [Rubrivivax sp.]